MRAVPHLCEFYPGICLTTEEKARKTLSQGIYRGRWGIAPTEVWWGSLRERDNLEELGVDRRIIQHWVFSKSVGVVSTGLVWLRMGTSGGLLWTRVWTSGLYKIQAISWQGEELSASQEGPFSTELVRGIALFVAKLGARLRWMFKWSLMVYATNTLSTTGLWTGTWTQDIRVTKEERYSSSDR